MPPLHERKDLRFYLDNAVYRSKPSQHATFVGIIQKYGTLEVSMHAADVILIHPAETVRNAYDDVRGTLVDYRYIEDDSERRERRCPRLPFTSYIITRTGVRSGEAVGSPVRAARRSGPMPRDASSLDVSRPHINKRRAAVAEAEESFSDEDVSAAEAEAQSQSRRRKHVHRHNIQARSDRSRKGTYPSVQGQSEDTDDSEASDNSQWPLALCAGFPPPPSQMKNSSRKYTSEARKWIEKMETYWDTHAPSYLTQFDRGKWISFACNGQITPSSMCRQSHFNNAIGRSHRSRRSEKVALAARDSDHEDDDYEDEPSLSGPNTSEASKDEDKSLAPANQTTLADSDWPRSLRSGFPPPPLQMKTLSGEFTQEGRKWIDKAKAHWAAHAPWALSDRERCKWISWASNGQVSPNALRHRKHIDDTAGCLPRHRGTKSVTALDSDSGSDTDDGEDPSPSSSRQWSRPLRSGFSNPPVKMKTSGDRYTSQAKRWLVQVEEYWDIHAGAKVHNSLLRGEWFSYASHGQISESALCSQYKLDKVLGRLGWQRGTELRRRRSDMQSQRDGHKSTEDADERPTKRPRIAGSKSNPMVKEETPILDLTADSDDEMTST